MSKRRIKLIHILLFSFTITAMELILVIMGSWQLVTKESEESAQYRVHNMLSDTIAALDSAGVLHTGPGEPLIKTLDGGLTIGIVSYNTVDSSTGEWQWRQEIKEDIDACKKAGCRLIIGFMHWGTVEYLTEPEAWAVQLAHDMADWGCDLIVGGHAQILQRMEYYHDVPIFYSMGNFCFGGNTGPDDMDSVIVQAQYEWDRNEDALERSALLRIIRESSGSLSGAAEGHLFAVFISPSADICCVPSP